jgi:hypothetical protein
VCRGPISKACSVCAIRLLQVQSAATPVSNAASEMQVIRMYEISPYDWSLSILYLTRACTNTLLLPSLPPSPSYGCAVLCFARSLARPLMI